MSDIESKTITIPMPIVAPLYIEADRPEFVHDVFDAFVKPGQDARELQSGEMRLLMAYLRAIHAALAPTANDCKVCSAEDEATS